MSKASWRFLAGAGFSLGLAMSLDAADRPPGMGGAVPPGIDPALLPEPQSSGAKALQHYCAQCHNLPGPGMHTADEWPAVVDRMYGRMRMMNGMMQVVAPQYTTLQDMIGRVVTHERNRVTCFLEESATPFVLQSLDSLLQADEQMYRISALKREPKDFSHKELKREVERRKFFQPGRICIRGRACPVECGHGPGRRLPRSCPDRRLEPQRRVPGNVSSQEMLSGKPG